MIISGFPGIGKSSICRTIPNYTDLESTPFKKNWEIYVDVIEHMGKNHYNVFVSSHLSLRKELQKRGLNYIFVVPEKNLKDEYIERYKKRGNSKEFIKQISDNWDVYTSEIPGEKVFRLPSETYLYDVLPTLKTLSKTESLKEDIGGTFSSNFSGFTPENQRAMVSLIDDQAIEDLKKEPEPLAEKVIEDIKDITIEDVCVD